MSIQPLTGENTLRTLVGTICLKAQNAHPFSEAPFALKGVVLELGTCRKGFGCRDDQAAVVE